MDAACQAIQKPAHFAGIDFTDTAAQQLVDDLRSIRVQRSDGTMEVEPGLYVEPVQLQVVCFRLWERLAETKTTIDIDDLESVGDVDQSLAEYYQSSVKYATEHTGVKERLVREWFESKLVRPGGIRGQVPMGTPESDGLSNAAITVLINAHIVRADKRIGITWFELAHDRLIEPVRRNNASWFKENLSLLQKHAAMWEAQERPEGMLLRGNELEQAITWAANHEEEITPIESRFLADSERAIHHEQEIHELKLREQSLREKGIKEREERRKRLIFWLILGLIITIGLALVAFVQRAEMQKQKQIAWDRLLLAKTQLIDVRESKMQIPKLGLAIEAYNRLRDTESYRALWSSTSQFNPGNLHLQTNGPVKSICFSTDSTFLVSRSNGNIIRVWDITKDAKQIPITINLDYMSVNDNSIEKVLCSPDGERIMANEQNEKGSNISVWSIKTGTKLLEIEQSSNITDFTISPDGKYIISGSKDGEIILWDANTGQKRAYILDDNSISTIIFSPNGDQVASANIDGDVLIWNLAENKIHRIKSGTQEVIIVYSPNSKWLVTGGKEGAITFWNAINGNKGEIVQNDEGITALSFSPDGNLLLSASEDGAYKIWGISRESLH